MTHKKNIAEQANASSAISKGVQENEREEVDGTTSLIHVGSKDREASSTHYVEEYLLAPFGGSQTPLPV
jgi:hypothetical protein